MVQGYGGRARFVVENYGDSELARRFGVTRYPAIFVGDVLVATPRDFGFYGKGEGAGDGRYTPWKSAASHERFRADLARMVDLLLAGKAEDARAEAQSPEAPPQASLPAFTATDLDGRPIAPDGLRGRAVLVEFWATWCPPCRPTLEWLGALKNRYGDRLAVVAFAVESDEADVRSLAAETGLPLRWAIGTPEVARAFGDVTAVPTLFLYGPGGQAAGAFFGAPPTLHAEVEAALARALQ